MSRATTTRVPDAPYPESAATKMEPNSARLLLRASKTWTVVEYINEAQRDPVHSSWAQRLLRRCSYVFTEYSAKGVPLLVHRGEWERNETVTAIVALQRMCMLILLHVWPKEVGRGDSLHVQHTPHKQRTLQQQTLK